MDDLPKKQRDIRPTLSVRISSDTIKRLKLFAVEHDTAVQDVAALALDEWLAKHGC